MAKVGIVTFHSAHNFGAVLQCFALKTVLENLGHKVSVIDHRNSGIEECYAIRRRIPENINGLTRLRVRLSNMMTYSRRLSRFEKYQNFIYNHLLSKDSNITLENYDSIVFGSDQIWRWDIIKDDRFYWGECGVDNVKKISYAGSAGRLDSHFDANLSYLKNFDALGVREFDLYEYLKAKGINSVLTLDPSLLVGKSEWINKLKIPVRNGAPYVFVYSMRDRRKVLKIANAIAEKENMEVKEIFNSFISPRFIFKQYSDGGPLDFVSLLSNASYVVTDSFHGTAFSVIFNKRFTTVRLNDGYDNRAEGLLKSLGLQDRMSESLIDYGKAIDYYMVCKKLETLKKMSIEFLKGNLGS